MYPSIRRINQAFPGQGAELRKILENYTYARKIAIDFIDSCYNPPRKYEVKLEALNRIADGACGVEYIAHRDDTFAKNYGLSYLNTGDTYKRTIIYDHYLGSWRVDSWGGIVEMRSRNNWYI